VSPRVPDRTVLITGCSTGIGRATVVRFATAGWRVVATARRQEAVADLASERVATLALDVCDEAGMRAAVESVGRSHGGIDVLVNNAGYGMQAPVEEADLDDVRRQFETNVFGLVRLSQLVLPGMRERGWGRVVNVSSMGGRLTFPGGGFCHATKHAVEAISDALRLEVAGFGVAVVLVEPGPVLTEFGSTTIASIDAATTEDAGPYAPFKQRLGQRLASAYDGRRSNLASSADDVAATIVKAVEARRPRARYVVGPVAHALLAGRRVLPDRAFDALIRSQYPVP
jgi:NAD(P)-dependent dehydrogenase (short-subunit alcohol dehydrogenase family)